MPYNSADVPAHGHASAPTASAPPARRWHRLTVGVSLAFTWVMLLVLGAILLETFMVYPNVFADPPASLELTMDFLAVAGPSDFFPPVGLTSWLLGGAALALAWRWPAARWWLLLSLVAILAEGLVSVFYFWPRNAIMFVEGLSVHSAEYLIEVAHDFETWHWRSRMVFNTIAAVSSFAGFLALYRTWLMRSTVSEGVPPLA